ncbi:hypothetical protein A8U91_03623 [Halomonas elongata]|uniref:Uncharacterized protein n=1 Tax=Halomonas elongata TaxID=2746 RepID=A0A1B8NX28_HALEL|nr:hypothetical protein A8U91_03623 [Halomonas elongata]
MHPMDPTAGRADSTRDHVPVHVCFQGVAFKLAPSGRKPLDTLGTRRIGDCRKARSFIPWITFEMKSPDVPPP